MVGRRYVTEQDRGVPVQQQRRAGSVSTGAPVQARRRRAGSGTPPARRFRDAAGAPVQGRRRRAGSGTPPTPQQCREHPERHTGEQAPARGRPRHVDGARCRPRPGRNGELIGGEHVVGSWPRARLRRNDDRARVQRRIRRANGELLRGEHIVDGIGVQRRIARPDRELLGSEHVMRAVGRVATRGPAVAVWSVVTGFGHLSLIVADRRRSRTLARLRGRGSYNLSRRHVDNAAGAEPHDILPLILRKLLPKVKTR
jgi:hypothetical protein